MNNKNILIASIVGLVLIAGLVVMRGSSNKNMEENTIQPSVTAIQEKKIQASPGAETTAPGTQDNIVKEEAKTIDIEAGSFYYSLKEIRVKKGDKIKIVMTAKDMMHDFNIDELGVKMPVVKAGETGTVEFTAEKVGEFEYYCSVGQHRKLGQVGTLIVE